ncbi:hypothetical protein D4764_13G0005570 [Takifugu flavidus]|uniref:Uncharacterized protein n=1 Tax=Takifugu flavidus TaxID=433684 RepID=A0A5C6P907_9TELE|nr:hypothetical protein D4764_13G0005570 [Takifugu flavidus]
MAEEDKLACWKREKLAVVSSVFSTESCFDHISVLISACLEFCNSGDHFLLTDGSVIGTSSDGVEQEWSPPQKAMDGLRLPPLIEEALDSTASILASPQRPHNLRYAHTPAQTHKPLHLPPLPTRRFSPILALPCFPPHSRHRFFPWGQDFLQSLELINGKVAANDKLWEKDNKLEMHQSTERGGDKLALTLQDPRHMEPRLLIYSCGKKSGFTYSFHPVHCFSYFNWVPQPTLEEVCSCMGQSSSLSSGLTSKLV